MLRRLILLTGLIWCMAMQAFADPLTESVVRQLQERGYQEVIVTRTWLGRNRIVATSPGRLREIILNPTTGEILRDFQISGSNLHIELLEEPNTAPAPEGGADE